MALQPLSWCAASLLSLTPLPSPAPGHAHAQTHKQPSQSPKSSAKQTSPQEQLQQAINTSRNDRAALVRNLESYLKEYPDSRQRPQIYRALVEASLQLRDDARAGGYAERIVALNPDDISMTILTIQLLQRSGDETALRRPTNYATPVLEVFERKSPSEKSPKSFQEEVALQKKP